MIELNSLMMDRPDRAAIHAALADESRLAIVDLVAHGDLASGELAHRLNMPTNLLAHHLNVLESAGVVVRRVSEGDRRRRYVVLRRERLAALRLARPASPQSLLFVCTHNSARSQYAAALWRQRTGGLVASAGTHPAPSVNRTAVLVAREFGVELKGMTPRAYDEVVLEPDLVVSVCDRAGESPVPFAAHRMHWSVPDPVASGSRSAFRTAFSEITSRVDGLAEEAGPT